LIEKLREPFAESMSKTELEEPAEFSAERARFHAWALSQMHDAAIGVDNNELITYWNEGAERLYGFKAQEVLGSLLKHVIHYEWIAAEDEQIAFAALAASRSWRGQNIHFLKSGKRIYVESSVKLLRNEQNSPVGMLAVIRDITERHQAEIRSAAFASLARKLSGATVPLDAAKIIADTAQELFGWDSCTIDLYDAGQDLVRPVLHVDTVNGTRLDTGLHRVPRKPTARSRRVIRQGPALTVRKDPSRFDHDSVPFGDKSRPSAVIMDVPICHAATVIGLLSIQSYTPYSYDQTALRHLEALAEHCGEALSRIYAEESLVETEARYRDLIENSHELICTHDLEGRILSANRAATEALGYDGRAYLGKNLKDILAPEVRDGFDDYLKRIIRDGVASGLLLVETKTGGRRIWEYYNTLRTDGVATPIVRGMANDITKRKRAEQSLRLFRSLIDQSTDAIEVIDADTLRFLDCNEHAHKTLGYSRQEFLGLSIFDIDPMATPGSIAFHDAEMERSGFTTLESVHRRKDGSTFPVEVNIKLVRLDRRYRLAVVRDISARKQANEALREAEQKYRHIFENAGEGIFQSTPDGRFIAANPALARMYGFDSPEELIESRRDISRQVYADPIKREEFKALLEHKGVVRGYEHEVLHRDGTRFWISVNARLVRDEEGTVRYYEGTVQDITDRKNTGAELIRQKEILEKIVDNIPVMINFTDRDGHVKLVNKEWQRTLGWSLSEILSDGIDPFSECYPDPKDRAEALSFVTSSTGDWVDFRTRIRDGSVIDTSWARVKLSDGTTIGIGQDITARKVAEAAIRKAEQQYRELFENAKDAIYVHDLTGHYTSVNAAAERLTGYARHEILGKTCNSFIAPDGLDRVRENMWRKLRQEGETTYEVEVIAKDGRRVPVEVSSRLIYEGAVPVGVQGTARDITDRKRAERELRSYSRRLIDAQEEERKRIARELHDEIGQVLTAVQMNQQTLEHLCEEAPALPYIKENISIVEEALRQVRDLSLELRPSMLDDLGLAAALRWYVKRYAVRTGVKAEIAIGALISHVRLSRELETACFRIVQEALTNVVRHSKAKSARVKLQLRNGQLMLTIRDDGLGMDLPTLQKEGGAAASLGLRGMEERALAVRGEIQIESIPGRGTQIRARFPIVGVETK
jgi:PAS domain S-box-containing protein